MDFGRSTLNLKEEEFKNRLFKKGIKLSWYVFFLAFIFLISWAIGFPGKKTFISSSDFYSKIFFFLNPNLFNVVFLQGNMFSYLKGSVDEFSFVFLLSYIVCFSAFLLCVFCCIWLFFISYKTSIRPFHYISCLGLFPIIGFFLIFIFMFRMLVFQTEMRFKKTSRYLAMFQEEKFEDSLFKGFDEKTLFSRPITSEFGKKHYDRFFGNHRKDWLKDLYKKLDSSLS